MKKIFLAAILPLAIVPVLASAAGSVAESVPSTDSINQALANRGLDRKTLNQTVVKLNPQPTSKTEDKISHLTNPETGIFASRDQQIARQMQPLAEALLGEWITNGGKTEYYFAPGQVTVVNELTDTADTNDETSANDGTEGNQVEDERSPAQPESAPNHQVIQVMHYQITGVDEATGTVQLKIDTPLNWLEVRTLQFKPNRQVLTELLDLFGHNLNSEWTYASQQQSP